MSGNYIVALLISLYGTVIGSFLNVLIDRIPEGKDVLVDRSQCDYCKKKLVWYELIPLVSYSIQQGKCRSCHHSLSLQYPLMELLTGVMFFIITVSFFPHWNLIVSYLIICSALLVIFVIDYKHYIIPDSMIIVGLIGSLLLVNSFTDLGVRVLSGFISFLFLYAIWFVTKGKGMGFGDVKFVFLMGFSLSFPAIVVGLYSAFLTGAVVGLILMLGRVKSLKSKIPFGPFLIIGFCIALVITDQVMKFFYV